MKKILKHTIAIFTAIIFLAGCSEDLLNEEPPHIITTTTLYTTYDGFQAGLNGLYSLVREDYQGENGGANHLRKEMWMNGTDNMTGNHEDGFARVAVNWAHDCAPCSKIAACHCVQNQNIFFLQQIVRSTCTMS